jgi:hypothetical protein
MSPFLATARVCLPLVPAPAPGRQPWPGFAPSGMPAEE